MSTEGPAVYTATTFVGREGVLLAQAIHTAERLFVRDHNLKPTKIWVESPWWEVVAVACHRGPGPFVSNTGWNDCNRRDPISGRAKYWAFGIPLGFVPFPLVSYPAGFVVQGTRLGRFDQIPDPEDLWVPLHREVSGLAL